MADPDSVNFVSDSIKSPDHRRGQNIKNARRQLTDLSERKYDMKPDKISTKYFLIALALVAAFAIPAVLPGTAAAIGTAECGLIGTWYGHTDSALAWMGVHTAGSTTVKGEMLLEWLRVKDDLLRVRVDELTYRYPNVTRLSDGRGVWEQTSKGKYNYTWYAYGNDTLVDKPVYSVRVSGVAQNTDCNNVTISFTYEVFDGFILPQYMSGIIPVFTITGNPDAYETRVPLTVVLPAP